MSFKLLTKAPPAAETMAAVGVVLSVWERPSFNEPVGILFVLRRYKPPEPL